MERSWSSRSIRTNATTGWKGGESRDERTQIKNQAEEPLPQCKLVRRVVDGKRMWVWTGLSLNGGHGGQLAKVGEKIQLSEGSQIIHKEETEESLTNQPQSKTWLDENREVEE